MAIAKINKTKSWLFQKINKIDKLLARCLKKKREKNQIDKIRNENGEITDNTEIQRIIRDYCQQLHANKMNNLEEMDKLLEKYNLPKVNQEQIQSLNRTIRSMEIKTVIKNLPTSKLQGPDSFTGEFYQKFLPSIQSLSRVRLFATPWTAAHHASLSITNSLNLLKLMSIKSVMPSNHLILCCPRLFLSSIFPRTGSFPMSQFFAPGGQSIGVSASASVLQWNQDWFPLGWTDWISLLSKVWKPLFCKWGHWHQEYIQGHTAAE